METRLKHVPIINHSNYRNVKRKRTDHFIFLTNINTSKEFIDLTTINDQIG